MWIRMNTTVTKPTKDMLQTLLDSRPGEIIAMEGSSTSGKDRMIKLLVMDDEERRIHVMHQDDKQAIIDRDTVMVNIPDPDVYVLSNLDQWDGISANQQVLLRWISMNLCNDKTIIITGECLHNHLPTVMDVLQVQYGDKFSLYQHKVDDLSLVNMNPYPFIQTGTLLRLGAFQRSIIETKLEPLFWKVILRRGYMVWLLATESVGCLNYCCEGAETDWRHSPLRLWLNGQFLDGFTDEERDAIMGNRSSGKEESADGEEAPSVWVEGNHENHARLNSDEFPIVDLYSGKAQQIRSSIYRLLRGEVYVIQGKRFFTFGGARSHDIDDGILDPDDYDDPLEFQSVYHRWRMERRIFRVKGVSWWPEELPSEVEMEKGRKALESINYEVDYVVTHCLPHDVASVLSRCTFYPDRLTLYFNSLLRQLRFDRWYCGHYHCDQTVMEKFQVLYHDIHRIL